MFAANTYDIHLATERDEASLSCLIGLDSGRPLRRPVLIGQIGGKPAAAILLADGRIVADPQRCPDHLLACLRVRAAALRAYEETPSLRTRMLAAVSGTDRSGSLASSQRTSAGERRPAGTTTNRRANHRPVRRPVLATS